MRRIPLPVIILLSLTAAAAIVVLYRMNTAPLPTLTTPSVTSSPEEQSTYENTRYGFAFTIPHGYEFENETGEHVSFSGTYGDNQIIPSELVLNFRHTQDFAKLASCEETEWVDDVQKTCIDGAVEDKEYNGSPMKTAHLLTGAKNSMASTEYVVQVERPAVEFVHHVIGGGVERRMEELLTTFVLK